MQVLLLTRRFLCAAAAGLLCSAFRHTAHAQVIEGELRDASTEASVPEAVVTLREAGSTHETSAASDSAGVFHL